MLEFNEEKHLYTWNGSPVVSTTQVTTRIAVRENDDNAWRSIAGSEFIVDQERTSIFGIEFHKAAAIIVKGKDADYDPALQPWVGGLKAFLHDYNLNYVIRNKANAETYLVEQSLYSDKFKYAGTMDWFFSLYDLPPTLIDWKTSTNINKKTTRMQTAAYDNLIREHCAIRKNKKINRWTVRLDPKLKLGYEIDKRYTEAEDWNNFLSCLNVYKNFI